MGLLFHISIRNSNNTELYWVIKLLYKYIACIARIVFVAPTFQYLRALVPSLACWKMMRTSRIGISWGLLVTGNMPSSDTTVGLHFILFLFRVRREGLLLHPLWCCCQDEWPHHRTKRAKDKRSVVAVFKILNQNKPLFFLISWFTEMCYSNGNWTDRYVFQLSLLLFMCEETKAKVGETFYPKSWG